MDAGKLDVTNEERIMRKMGILIRSAQQRSRQDRLPYDETIRQMTSEFTFIDRFGPTPDMLETAEVLKRARQL
jgi:hypothetical protein